MAGWPRVPERGRDQKTDARVQCGVTFEGELAEQDDRERDNPGGERAVATPLPRPKRQTADCERQETRRQWKQPRALHEEAQAERAQKPRVRGPARGARELRQQRHRNAGKDGGARPPSRHPSRPPSRYRDRERGGDL